MPTIPSGTKFHGVHQPVETINKGSSTANALREVYSIEDIAESVEGGGTPYTLGVEQDGSNVDLNLTNSNTSTVVLATGTNVSLVESGDDTVTISAVASGAVYSVETITSGRTLTTSDHVIFTDFGSEQSVVLPDASDNPGRVYIIRAKKDTQKCLLTASGSDQIEDNAFESSIDVNAGKGRTVISDGVSLWYAVTSTGA